MTQELREKVALLFRTMYATEADRLIAADAAIAIIRAETLEEAASELDGWDDMYGDAAARSIRALKEKP